MYKNDYILSLWYLFLTAKLAKNKSAIEILQFPRAYGVRGRPDTSGGNGTLNYDRTSKLTSTISIKYKL